MTLPFHDSLIWQTGFTETFIRFDVLSDQVGFINPN